MDPCVLRGCGEGGSWRGTLREECLGLDAVWYGCFYE